MNLKHIDDRFDGDKKLLAENLSALLKKNRLTPNQLAHVLNIPVMTVRRIMSGETGDPRVSTIKMISDYFNVSIDEMIGIDQSLLICAPKFKTILIPKVTWDDLEYINNLKLQEWLHWQSISLHEDDTVSKNSFAIESRPSMYPRFPEGTVFIIDPKIKSNDGDIVLIKLKNNNEFTLRQLVIDPPNSTLNPLTSSSEIIQFDPIKHEIIGVSLIVMLYNPKISR